MKYLNVRSAIPGNYVGKGSLTWADKVITCCVFCFVFSVVYPAGWERKVWLSYHPALPSVCVNKLDSGLNPRHHQADLRIICPNMPADETANLFLTLREGTDQ